MKIGPVTKLDKRNTTSKNDDDVMSADSDIIAFFLIHAVKFAVTWKPESGCMVYKITFSLTITFYLTKTEKKN